MKLELITEGKVVKYKARIHSGKGKVTQKYQDSRKKRDGTGGSWWVIVHDKARNASVTVRPSQISSAK